MKKLIALFCVASAVTALADTPAASDNVFGVLRVDSTSAQTIVSIPWEAPGGGVIKVKDAIKTANLTKGDQLYYYDTTAATPAYKLWVLDDNGWVGATTVKGEGDGKGIVTASAGGDEELARGGALILVRKEPSKPFYLYGQYTADAASLNVVKGTVEKPAYSLVAPAATTATLLDSLASENVGAKDTVFVRDSSGNTRALVCRQQNGEYKWGIARPESMWSENEIFTSVPITIPAGEGFWYVSYGGVLTAPDQNN